MSKRIVLALSGGIARGPAHLGVLAVLEREGVPIHGVAGVSAGAVVGALHCAGLRADDLNEFLPELGWRLLANPAWPGRGWLSFDSLEDWIEDLIGDVYFSQLRRPLAVGVTELETRAPVTFTAGRVARVVHASCAVPGLVAPVVIDGRRYADGGASNNLPAAAARALGADYVIGVDLFGPGAIPVAGPLTTGMAMLENFVRRSGGGLEAVDLLISPDLRPASYMSFDQRSQRLALTQGVRAAEAALPAIWRALAEPAAG